MERVTYTILLFLMCISHPKQMLEDTHTEKKSDRNKKKKKIFYHIFTAPPDLGQPLPPLATPQHATRSYFHFELGRRYLVHFIDRYGKRG